MNTKGDAIILLEKNLQTLRRTNDSEGSTLCNRATIQCNTIQCHECIFGDRGLEVLNSIICTLALDNRKHTKEE